MKTVKELEQFIDEYGFNPLVSTDHGLNTVDIEKSAEINKETLQYLQDLSK